MRVLITGAGGSLGRALAREIGDRHDLVCSDVEPLETAHEFVQVDVRNPEQVHDAAAGVDAIVHTPAWHGVHTDERSEREFWELNVDGTYNTFEAAAAAEVETVVFASSQAALAGAGGKYAFTKTVGETTAEYFARNHDLRAISVRPAAFAIHTGDRRTYGERLLRNAVDRRDVVGVTVAALENDAIEYGAYSAVRDDPYTDDELAQWEHDPVGVLENYVEDAGRLVDEYDIELADEINPNGGFPGSSMTEAKADLGYNPQYTFVSFLERLAEHDARGDAEAWLGGEIEW